MARFRTKPCEIGAITFDELVQYGRDHGANIVNGMPWSFDYATVHVDDKGNANHHIWSITHENDDCYLIPTLEGIMKMGRDDLLITGLKGEIYPCKREIFSMKYEAVN